MTSEQIATPGSQTRAGSFREDLEGLRGIAVIMVVMYHAKFLAGGYVSLEIFFVLSGFLISRLLINEITVTGTLNLTNFYARRCFRLLPAATFVLLATVALVFFCLPASYTREFGIDAGYAAVFAANFRAIFQSVDYLAADMATSPVQHYWSLSVEEQFYFFLPVVFWLLAKTGANFRRLCILLMGAAVACSFALTVWLTDVSQSWAYFSLPARAWEFGLGVLLAMHLDYLKCLPRWLMAGLTWMGFFLLLGTSVLYGDQTSYPGTAILLPTIGAACLVAAGCGGTFGFHKYLFANPISRFVGRISYSLYLWHWPVLTIPMIALGGDMHWSLRIAAVIVSGLLAMATVALIEEPFRRSLPIQRHFRAALRLTAGGIGIVTTAVLSAQLYLRINPEPVQFVLVPSLAEAKNDKPRVYDDHCSADFEQTAIPECIYGNRDSPVNVFLVGDSHAAQWFPAVERLAIERGWRLHSITKSNCPFNAALMAKKAQNGLYRECLVWRKTLQERIKTVHPDLVIVANSRMPTLVTENGTLLAVEDRLKPWLRGLSDALVSLHASAKQVVVLADTPRPDFNVPDCLLRVGLNSSQCNLDRSTAINSEWLKLERLAVANSGATYIDPTNWICPNSECPPTQNGILIFRDSSHLTTAFAERLTDNLSRAIKLR